MFELSVPLYFPQEGPKTTCYEIWYLLHMRASKTQMSLHEIALTRAHKNIAVM